MSRTTSHTKNIKFLAYTDIHHHEYTNGLTGEDVEAVEEEAYQLMVEHFAAVLAQEVPIAYPPQEAIQALVVLDEIRLRWK